MTDVSLGKSADRRDKTRHQSKERLKLIGEYIGGMYANSVMYSDTTLDYTNFESTSKAYEYALLLDDQQSHTWRTWGTLHTPHLPMYNSSHNFLSSLHLKHCIHHYPNNLLYYILHPDIPPYNHDYIPNSILFHSIGKSHT